MSVAFPFSMQPGYRKLLVIAVIAFFATVSRCGILVQILIALQPFLRNMLRPQASRSTVLSIQT